MPLGIALLLQSQVPGDLGRELPGGFVLVQMERRKRRGVTLEGGELT